MKPRKVLLVGGGTAGSVMPLVALFQEMSERSKGKTEFLFVGTKNGIEKKIAKENTIPFTSIASGKLRRYFDVRNILDPFLILFGFFQACVLLKKFKPDVILTAGSFVTVPVAWAAKILRVPLFLHQQDIRKTLSNSLSSFAATKITVALKPSLSYFPKNKVELVGNPVRASIAEGSIDKAYNFFGLRKDLPIVLVLGGGTGALSVNELVVESLPKLTSFVQIIHLTGKNKKIAAKKTNYFPYEFLGSELKHAYAVADVVVTRAGLSTFTELAFLKKSTITIPIPGSHQEDNATYFKEKEATVILDQNSITPDVLVDTVRQFILDPGKKRDLGARLHALFVPNARERYVDLIESVLDEKYVRKYS